MHLKEAVKIPVKHRGDFEDLNVCETFFILLNTPDPTLSPWILGRGVYNTVSCNCKRRERALMIESV